MEPKQDDSKVHMKNKEIIAKGFHGDSVVKNPPAQETWVRFLVQEDPTRPGATKPVYHNY